MEGSDESKYFSREVTVNIPSITDQIFKKNSCVCGSICIYVQLCMLGT